MTCLVLLAAWLVYRAVRWWRLVVAWQHSTDGGAEGRRIRAQDGRPPSTGLSPAVD